MTESPDPAAIVLTDVCKSFAGVKAVNGISFRVEAGQTVALLGGNGAGKTTTISMLLGLLSPTKGEIRVLGARMPDERHTVLGLMNFSSPYVDLPKRLKVWENLTVYAHLYGVRDVKGRIKELADDLELERFLKRPFGDLSAGQKTRVALAKSLLNAPKLLLMDEPTASLDPDTGDWVRSYLERYRERTGATILLASHNMGEVERLADNVLMMRGGKIVDQGSPKDLIKRHGHDTLEQVFLDIARAPHFLEGEQGLEK
ncbi:ABC transporter ATP-binding protein [Magnetovibrio blakemorei]|uniref:ABC transporter n=1 Tax=Magnetovibrio blakemorei TaxID=28181 RepID=A0A1E5Q6M4_9PROT|nr:ABC transporter ATP-binding protein [Magnetovibrio blakemorei]OEJ66521.1 ABC transporter [Magnetovibrio blakemorei]